MIDQLSSGLPGLAIGALLGVLVGALFEDRLKRIFTRLGRLYKHARSANSAPSSLQTFQLGPLGTNVLIVEGDGTQVIDEQAVRVIIQPTQVRLPADLQVWYTEIADEQAQLQAEGSNYCWNGLNYAVVGLSVTRVGIDENPAVTLTLAPSDYYTFLTTQHLDRRLPDGRTARQTYLDPYDALHPPAFMSASFGIYVAVVTSDSFTVFAKRSASVGAFRGRWDASVNEALSRSLDSTGRTPPNLYDVARRGIHEELALESNEYRLELLAFNLDRDNNQWGCIFVAFLHEVTGRELSGRISRGSPDNFEHEVHEFEAFRPRAVLRYLLRVDRVQNFTPVAPAVFYLSLVRMYGRAHVEREVRRIVRRRTSDP
jgi:hypothetical protein